MMITGSGICLVISVLATMIMALKSYEHIDSYDGAVSLLLPFLIMAYWLKIQVSSPEAALVLIALIEIAASLLLAVTLFSMLRSIGVRVRTWIKAIVYGVVTVLLFPVWRVFHLGKSAEYVEIINSGDGYASRLVGSYHVYEHYAFLLAVLIMVICVVAFIMSRRKVFSRCAVAGYLAFVSSWVAMNMAENLLRTDFSGLPFLYMLADVLLALTYEQSHSHDISTLIANNQKSGAQRGCVALGLNGKFLGSNEEGL